MRIMSGQFTHENRIEDSILFAWRIDKVGLPSSTFLNLSTDEFIVVRIYATLQRNAILNSIPVFIGPLQTSGVENYFLSDAFSYGRQMQLWRPKRHPVATGKLCILSKMLTELLITRKICTTNGNNKLAENCEKILEYCIAKKKWLQYMHIFLKRNI